MELKFYKEEGKWYIDIPWDGDKSELEMVMVAHWKLKSRGFGSNPS